MYFGYNEGKEPNKLATVEFVFEPLGSAVGILFCASMDVRLLSGESTKIWHVVLLNLRD